MPAGQASLPLFVEVAPPEGSGEGRSSRTRPFACTVDGQRVVNYEDGSRYVGQLQRPYPEEGTGLRCGWGRLRSATQHYDGEWKDDEQDGEGHLAWADGRLYQGQFRKGKFDGQGWMVWPTPKGLMCFEGQYQNDMKHGFGKFFWPDGRAHFGSWEKGKRHGEATYVDKSGAAYRGVWVEDKLGRWLDEETTVPNDHGKGTPAEAPPAEI